YYTQRQHNPVARIPLLVTFEQMDTFDCLFPWMGFLRVKLGCLVALFSFPLLGRHPVTCNVIVQKRLMLTYNDITTLLLLFRFFAAVESSVPETFLRSRFISDPPHLGF